MAILANRTKNTNLPGNFVKSSVLFLYRKSFLVLFVLSFLFLYYSPQNRSLSKLSLEILGNCSNIVSGAIGYVDKALTMVTYQLSKINDLSAKNIELELAVAKLKQETLRLQQLNAENGHLKELLHYAENDNSDFITTRLLNINASAFSKYGVIGAGSRQRVEIDDVVTSSSGLVGKVVEVSENFAKVLLVNDSNFRLPIISETSRERGILVGAGEVLKIIYLSETHNITENEKILTSGDGIVFPYGIEVAKVLYTDKNEVIATPIVDLSKVEYVIVHKD